MNTEEAIKLLCCFQFIHSCGCINNSISKIAFLPSEYIESAVHLAAISTLIIYPVFFLLNAYYLDICHDCNASLIVLYPLSSGPSSHIIDRECISVLIHGLQKFAIMHNVSKLVNKYNKYEITCRILTGDSKFLAKCLQGKHHPRDWGGVKYMLVIATQRLWVTNYCSLSSSPRVAGVCLHIVPLSPCLYPLSSAGLDPALSQHVAVQFPGPDCPATKMDY